MLISHIVDEYYILIHSLPNFYAARNKRVQELRAQDTATAPNFAQIWPQLSRHISDLPLTAHNSPFDQSYLQAVLTAYALPDPHYSFYCTLKAARRTFGSRLPNHQLQTVAKACGFDLSAHHHALEDARACAHIALQLIDFSTP